MNIVIVKKHKIKDINTKMRQAINFNQYILSTLLLGFLIPETAGALEFQRPIQIAQWCRHAACNVASFCCPILLQEKNSKSLTHAQSICTLIKYAWLHQLEFFHTFFFQVSSLILFTLDTTQFF